MQSSPNNCSLKQLSQDFFVDKFQKIGSGSSSDVYKGYNKSLDQIVAVKLLHKQYVRNYEKIERQLIIMENIGKFQNPNIMGYYGYCNDEADGIYCFLQYCAGGSLKKYIQKSRIPEIKVLSMFEQIVDGMKFLNQNEIIHRDLTPQNIYLTEWKSIKIGDFGQARENSQNMTNCIGTYAYSAPQVFVAFGDHQYSYNCDVWSGGVILYEMLTGKMLFKNVNKKNQLYKQMQKLRNNQMVIQIPDNIHPKWVQILKSMLIFDYKARPTFGELKNMYEEIFKKMRQQLKQKYGYQDYYDDQQYDVLLTLSNSNPYKSSIKTPKEQYFSSYLRKLNQQRSFERVENVRKWLTYRVYKNQFLTLLPRLFTNDSYNWTQNIYKLILVFLSLMNYIKNCKSLISQILKLKISTPLQKIQYQQLCQCHRDNYISMLNSYKTKVQKSCEKFKTTIKKSVVDPIMSKYIFREKEKKILESYAGLMKLIQKVNKQGEFDEQFDYLSLYATVANSQRVFLDIDKMQNTAKFSAKDCRIYCHIRVVAQLQRLFPANRYREQNFIGLKKQQLQNSTKQQYLQIIDKDNINVNIKSQYF